MNSQAFNNLLKTKNIDEDSSVECVTISCENEGVSLEFYGWSDDNFKVELNEFGFFNEAGKWNNLELDLLQKKELRAMIIEEANNLSLKKEDEKADKFEAYHPYNYTTSTLANRR